MNDGPTVTPRRPVGRVGALRAVPLGVTLVLGAIALTGCSDAFFAPQPGTTPPELFTELWTSFEENYGPFAERGIDWQAAYETYRPLVTEATTDDELYSVATDMLATLDDGHVSLTAPGRTVFRSNGVRRNRTDYELFDTDIVRDNYLDAGYHRGEGFDYGTIDGRVVYFHPHYVGQNFASLSEAIAQIDVPDGIIIDMRHNTGGDFTYAFNALGRFTDRRRLVFSSRTKNGRGADDFSAWKDWHLDPSGTYTDAPIVLLVDKWTISAGERASMALMVLPQVTAIGEPTNGSMATMIGRELPNGWYYTLPIQNTRFADGVSYEGVGLPVDIAESNQLAEVEAGEDRVLERAIAELP